MFQRLPKVWGGVSGGFRAHRNFRECWGGLGSHLGAAEEVGQVFHGVAPHTGHVAEAAGLSRPQRPDPSAGERGHLPPQLQPQRQRLREALGQRHCGGRRSEPPETSSPPARAPPRPPVPPVLTQQPPVAAPHVCELHAGRGGPRGGVGRKKTREQRGPVHVLRAGGAAGTAGPLLPGNRSGAPGAAAASPGLEEHGGRRGAVGVTGRGRGVRGIQPRIPAGP